MPIKITQKGDLKRTQEFLRKMTTDEIFNVLDAAGRAGVDALASATPRDSGVTAASWGYEFRKDGGRYLITWTNSSVNRGFSIVIGLQYGHGTGTGGYVAPNDFINPAIRPIFDAMARTVWQEVKRS